jgi:hypothetical protein
MKPINLSDVNKQAMNKRMAFDTEELFKSSETDTHVERNLIYPNPLNEKYMKKVTDRDIEMLAESIKDTRLLHNLVVISDGTGRYRLISGEKRWRAINLLSEEEYREKFPTGIMCSILSADEIKDKDDELILLLSANVIVLSNGMYDKEQLCDLIAAYQRKGLARIDIVNYLTDKLNVSASTIRRLYCIAQAIDPLKEICDDGRIPENVLAILAQDKPETQKIYADYINNNYEPGDVISESEAYRIKKEAKRGGRSDSASMSGSKEFNKFYGGFESVDKCMKKMKKANIDAMTQPEVVLCINTLEKNIKLMEECLSVYQEHLKKQ